MKQRCMRRVDPKQLNPQKLKCRLNVKKRYKP